MSDQPGGDRDQQAVARAIERFAVDLTEAGIPRMPSRVFAAVLMTDSGSLTAAELAEGLQVSPAAVSGAVRYLVQVGLIAREREPGARRDQFTVSSDTWYEAIAHRETVLARWEKSLRDGIDAVGVDSPAGARLQDTVEFFDFLRAELPRLLQRWRESRG